MSLAETNHYLKQFYLLHTKYLSKLAQGAVPDAWQIRANRLCQLIGAVINDPDSSMARGDIDNIFNLKELINRVNMFEVEETKEWESIREFLLDIPRIQIGIDQKIFFESAKDEESAQEQLGFLVMNIFRS